MIKRNQSRLLSALRCLVLLIGTFGFGSAHAAVTDIVTLWTDPVPNTILNYNSDLHVKGSWKLPAFATGKIWVTIDNVEVGQIVFSNISGGTPTGSFDWNGGLMPSGANHTVKLDAGWIIVDDLGQVTTQFDSYDERVFTVTTAPAPVLMVKNTSGVSIASNLADPGNVSLLYPNIQVATTYDQTVYISNGGGGVVSGIVSLVESTSDGFVVVGTASYNLDANDPPVPVTIRFTPSDTAVHTKRIEFTCSSGCSSPIYRIKVSGSGAPNPVPGNAVPGVMTPFGSVNLNANITRTVSVQNLGGLPVYGEVTVPTGMAGQYTCISGCHYGIGGGSALPPGGTIIATFRFAPTVPGVDTVNAFFSSCADVGGADCGSGNTLAFAGVGNNYPILSVDPPSWYEPGHVNVNHTLQKSFLIVNSGAQPLVGTFTISSGIEFTCLTNCSFQGGNAIPVGGSTVVKVQFLATTPGIKLGSAHVTNVNGDIGNSFLDIPFQIGAYDGAGMGYSGLSYDFGNQVVGSWSTSQGVLTLTNTGTQILEVNVPNSVALPLPPNTLIFQCQSGCGSSQIPVDGTLEIKFRFRPENLSLYSLPFTITSNDPDAPSLTVMLSGTGVAPLLSVTPSVVQDLGWVNVGSVVSQSYTISNSGVSGSGDFTVTAMDQPHYLCVTNCGALVYPPGLSRVVVFEYVPDHQYLPADPASRDDETIHFQVSHSVLGAQSDITRDLVGRGNIAPRIFVSKGTSYILSNPASPGLVYTPSVNVNSTMDMNITVTNTGLGALTGSLSLVNHTDFVCITLPDCSFSLTSTTASPNASKTFTIRFQPLTAGTINDSITVAHDGGNDWNGINTIPVSGTGNNQPIICVTQDIITDNSCAVPLTYLDFNTAVDALTSYSGLVYMGSAKTVRVHVSNIGAGSMTGNIIASPLTLGGYFYCLSGCAYTLAGGEWNHEMYFTFIPYDIVSHVQAVTLPGASTIAGSPAIVTFSGQGVFSSIISIILGDTDFGSVVRFKNRFKEKTFRLKNSGVGHLGPGVFTTPAGSPFTICSAGVCSHSGGSYDLDQDETVDVTVRYTPTIYGEQTEYVQMDTVPAGKFKVRGTGVQPFMNYREI